MDVEYFRTLFDFTYWARDRLLAATEGMTEEEYAAPNGFTYKSLRGILTHALSAQESWLRRARGEVSGVIDRSTLASEENVPTIEALRSRWAEEEAKQRAYLAT